MSGVDTGTLRIAAAVTAESTDCELMNAAADEIDRLREQMSSDRIKGAKAVVNEHLRTAKAEAERDRLRERVEQLEAECDE
jgi:hypothetical protein